MSDKYYLNSYLIILKGTAEVYVHGTEECANKRVRDILKKSLDNTLSMQYDTYNKMTELGYYIVENVDKNTICKTLSKLEA